MENGAAESDSNQQLMEMVDFAVWRLENPYRTTIQFLARNLALGASVWVSPRIPTDERARGSLIIHSRALLAKALNHDGIA
jgi:hypothetical protein